MTESDTDLVVEYEEPRASGSGAGGHEHSLSDSNTVNQDADSFSILEGDSLLGADGPELDMPPLFVHVTCSVNMKSCHGSMPMQTLPTCLGGYQTHNVNTNDDTSPVNHIEMWLSHTSNGEVRPTIILLLLQS